jgi:hypothetical protein
MVQNWIYNQALGKMQGYTPPASYLVGRDLFRAAARVSHSDPQLGWHAAEAAAWIRRLRRQGASWHPLPVPSVPELRPNMKAERDQEWHAAKREIAQAQFDLTLLPYVGPERRTLATTAGIIRWDDPRLSASTLGFGDSTEGRRIDAVLAANRLSGNESVLPTHLASNIGGWQQVAQLECFVMVESVNDQDDDFKQLPERGGTAMFFMITFGWVDGNGQWQSRQLIARDLTRSGETDLRIAWQTELSTLAKSHGLQAQDIRLFHWGPLPPTLRDLTPPLRDAVSFPPPLAGGRVGAWFDVLENLIHKEPVTVRGAFTFGLADMARAFHSLGLIEAALPAVPPGTLAAMAGAWSSAREAKQLNVALEQIDSMQVIGRFSSAACQSMMEILALLRQRASASLPEAA